MVGPWREANIVLFRGFASSSVPEAVIGASDVLALETDTSSSRVSLDVFEWLTYLRS